MTVLIVGGAGYIGSHCVLDLIDNSIDCVVYDNLSTGYERLAGLTTLVKGDILDVADLSQTIRKYSIDSIMHLAGSCYVGESVIAPERYYQNNIVGSLNLLRAMLDCGLDKIVFSSSCSTYGNVSKLPITEDTPLSPINPYAFSKLVVERMLEDFAHAHAMRYVVLRYFNAAGADKLQRAGELHEPESHLIPLSLKAAKSRAKLSIYGTDYPTPDGTCIRDYVHVSDIASAHRLALSYLKSSKSSTYFNIGSDTGYSVREVIKTCEQVTGLAIETETAQRRPGDPAVLVASSEKIRKVLGWQPQHSSLPTIIESAWKWLSVQHHE